jgi:triacylglycerol esterase/lipase EstA (alpha/beta hydrolase family)
METQSHLAVLIPGFFGFDRLANIPYFVRVDDALAAAFHRRRHALRVVQALVPPTASLDIRASALIHEIVEKAGDATHIHLIGHSSGGLDLRLALSDHALPVPSTWAEKIVPRIRSAITIATPHYGTPLADLGAGIRVQVLLRMLSWLTVRGLAHGYLPMRTMVTAGRILVHLDDIVGIRGTVLDQLYEQLLVLSPRNYVADLRTHLREVSNHQGLVQDLCLEQAKRRNRLVRDRGGVRYGCVVTRAESPSWRSMVAIGRDPYAQATLVFFRLLQRLAASTPSGYLPVAGAFDSREFWRVYGAPLGLRDNDGIVPTLSQLWGHLIAAVRADHFDVMGYFAGRTQDANHLDLVTSGSGFSPADFADMWDKIANFCLVPTPALAAAKNE